MNEKDKKIIAGLRKDGRVKLSKLSKDTSIAISTIFDRINYHKENKVINKFTTILNFSELGYDTKARIMIEVDKNDKDEVKNYLLKNSSINSLSRINNGYDFEFECIFKKMVDLEDFLDELAKRYRIVKQNTYLIIEDLRRESFMEDYMLVN